MSRKQTHELTVIIEARSKRALDDAIESLSRSACDIANSTDGVRIDVSDALSFALTLHKPQPLL